MQGIESKIQWREWSREVFQEALELDKPVLLLLEQFWCGLSRLMYVTSWNDTETACIIEQDYIPIAVDASRRPDIDRRFRAGEWPTVAFLTPDVRSITASTFLPPEVLIEALGSVANIWRTERLEITARAEESDSTRQLLQSVKIDPTRRPSPWMTSKILASIQAAADQDFGGFGSTPKVPHFDALELLLAIYARTGEESFTGMVKDTLDQMLECDLYDWEDGGFFRCCDGADWSSPRFEKLLVDQARHIQIYVRAHKVFGDIEYAEAAEGVLEYCERMLFNSASGVFANSQAADATYYGLTRDERERQSPPPVDKTVFTDSNCQMIRALLSLEDVMPNSGTADRAVRAFGKMETLNCQSGELAFHYHDGHSRLQGLLLDQVEVGLTLLMLEEYVGDGRYLARAVELGGLIEETYADERQAGYFDSVNPLELALLSARDKSFEDNIQLAIFFAGLGKMSGDEIWNERARTALAGFTGVWEKVGLASASYGLALLKVYAE
jgi:uncharacterized protein YyaL (SSP411 family)